MKRIIVLLLLAVSVNSYAQISIDNLTVSSNSLETGEVVTVTLALRNNHFTEAHDVDENPVRVSVGLPSSSNILRLNEPLLSGTHASSFGTITEIDEHNFQFDLSAPIPPSIAEGSVVFVTFELLAINPNPAGSAPRFMVQLQFPAGPMPGSDALPTSVMSPVFTVTGEPLSVSFGQLTARNLNNEKVSLDWNTFSETLNSGFVIERSADGRNWSDIGFVKSQAPYGNSSEELRYNFIDETPLAQENFYRLRQTDLNGDFTYSPTVMVYITHNNNIVLFPNPVQTHLKVSGLSLNSEIVIYNALGQVINRVNNQDNSQMDIDFSGLNSGVYLLEINNSAANSSETHRVIKH